MNKRTLAAALLSLFISGPSFANSETTTEAASGGEATEAAHSDTAPKNAGGDIAAGKEKSAVCAGCHGADGKAISPDYPNLGGQHEGYLAKQITAFRDNERSNQLMSPMAAGLTDDDIKNLAAYYASMPQIKAVATEENLDLGANIYRGGITSAGIAACTACHGPTAQGNPLAGYPSLSGQNAAYISGQLKLFRSGERNNDLNEMMRALAHRLTDAEIAAVSNYASGLH